MSSTASAGGTTVPEAVVGEPGMGVSEGAAIDQAAVAPLVTAPQAAPIRVCRKCSTQSQASGEFCPQCGARYSKRRRSRKARALIFGLPLVLVAVGGGVTAALIIHHDNVVAAKQAAHRHAVARAAAVKRHQQQAAARARAAEAKANATLANIKRHALVTGLEGAVKKDAEKDVANGLLQGPILSVDCQPATGVDATATPVANYTCLAVRSISGGTENGWRFTATIDLNSDSYSWRLGG